MTDEIKSDNNNEQSVISPENIKEEVSQPVMSHDTLPQNIPSSGAIVEENLSQPKPVANIPPPTSPKKKISKILVLVAGVFVGILVLLLIIRALSGRFGGAGSSDVVWWGVTFSEDAINPLIEDFKSKNPGVSVTYILQSTNDYRSRLTDAINKGTGPDIFEIHNSWAPMFVGALDIVPSEVMTEAEYSTNFYPVVQKDMSIDGGFGGIPLFMDALTLFVNTEIFEREGRVTPTTWEDLDRISKGLTKRDGEGVIAQSGVALGSSSNVDHWEEILSLLFLQNEADLSSPEGTLAEGAFDFFISFSKTEGTWDETMAESTKAFAAGKLAMLFAPLSRVSEIKTINPSLNFKTILLPQIAKASPDQPNVTYANYWVESVNVNSKKKTASWNLLKFMSEEENLMSLHASQERIVGVYPRTGMSDLQVSDSILGSVVSLLSEADSWYLYSETFDGESGLNSKVRDSYKVAVDALRSGVSKVKIYEDLLISLASALSKYATR